MSSPWGKQLKYGDFEIVGAREGKPRLLGEGSFGKTYEAVRTEVVGNAAIKEHVAVKVLNPDLLTSKSKRFQFIQELLALTKFQHSNLIHYIRCGEEGGEVYYAMELCRGGDLVQLARRYGPLSEKVVALIGLQVATGLREVHQRHRLVHRDVKPSNIMLVEEFAQDIEARHLAYRFEQQDSLCRVVDFGLVNFTLEAADSPQRFVGSPMYSSPEQICERPIDGRSDIYSLGMTLWYLLQGKGPLLDENGDEIKDMGEAMRRHTSPEEHDSSLPPNLSPEFHQILARTVAKRPEKRMSSAGELQTALRDFLSHAPEDDEAPEAFSVTRLNEPLDTVYELGEKIPSRWARASYAARERKSGGREVKLSVVANVLPGESESAEVTEAAGRLGKLAQLSRQTHVPEALVPLREVILTSDLLAFTEEVFPHLALSDVLKARASVKRPIGFAESIVVLRPLAEALDFLLQHGLDTVSLPCEEIWLTGPGVAELAADDRALTRPLGDWAELQVRFSMMCVPPKSSGEENSDAIAGQTMSGSMQMSEGSMHPVPVFARLVYRILNGSEVPAAVQFTPHAYVPAVTLSHASNNLLRDLLSSQKPWTGVNVILRELCTNEGVVLRAQTSSPAALLQQPSTPTGIGSSGIMRSTVSSSNPVQKTPTSAPPPASRPSSGSTGSAGVVRNVSRTVPPPLPKPSRQPAPTPPPSAAPPPGPIPFSQALLRPKWLLAGGGALVLGFLLLVFVVAHVFKPNPTKSSPTPVVVEDTPAPTPPPKTEVVSFEGKKPGEWKMIAGIPFRWCPPTSADGFTMGSPISEPGRAADEAEHQVVLTHGFWLAETELTQGQWQQVARTTLRQQVDKGLADETEYPFTPTKKMRLREYLNLSPGQADKAMGVEDNSMPMYWVPWPEAVEYCRRVTERERAAGRLPDDWSVCLPTEAQWEYACRAGTTTTTYAGDMTIVAENNAPILDDIAWYGGNSGVGYVGRGWDSSSWVGKAYPHTTAGPRAVGQKNANPWGLRDMLGNVVEWCADWYGPYPLGDARDPLGPPTGFARVIRGGAWNLAPTVCRAAARASNAPGVAGRVVGVRLCVAPNRPAEQTYTETAPPPRTASPAFEGTFPGQRIVIDGVGYLWCPPTGQQGFVMGSPLSEVGRQLDEVQHPVVLTGGFWIAETETSAGQWQRVVGTNVYAQASRALTDETPYGNPPKKLREYLGFKSTDTARAVANDSPETAMYWLNWFDAYEYCRRENDAAHANGQVPPGWEVRLPTEAQWEYAARAGTGTATYAGDLRILGRANVPILDKIAWYGGNSGVGYTGRGFPSNIPERQYSFQFAGPRAVGGKLPNSWGVHDPLGNVAEWCADWYGPYPLETVADPQGPPETGYRIVRGGSWASFGMYSRAAARFEFPPGLRAFDIGFRAAIVPAGR